MRNISQTSTTCDVWFIFTRSLTIFCPGELFIKCSRAKKVVINFSLQKIAELCINYSKKSLISGVRSARRIVSSNKACVLNVNVDIYLFFVTK